MALTSKCRPTRTNASAKRPHHSRSATCLISAVIVGSTTSPPSPPAYARQISVKVAKKPVNCMCKPRTSCWPATLSGPNRLCSGWHSVNAVKPCMIRACSVLAISSKTSSRPELLDSPSFLHSLCSLHISTSIPEQAVENSAFIASMAVRPRNALKSRVSRAGNSECNRLKESRTECMQDTSTRVGGHFLSTSCVIRSQRSSILALTKSGRMFSSTAPPEPARASNSFWKPSTESHSGGT
mmetsp:Transcript_67932/g.159900  ORF Transcript_67932/g.159900 Transcript_67932/m.159900 type:complete len:240 (+) Transcript_67932:792-1511(+)